MRTDAQAKWDSTANPRELVIHFKPSRAIPELTQDSFSPASMLHFIHWQVLCLDEMFKSLPKTLMLMSDGELFFRDFSLFPSYAD